ncbi:hypothetical protein KQI38_21040 [Tissierella carlieri]|uniref:hypothetical protein n=1 Tax=Tissierella carlieri TaxID=689904 RepID=UPI001C0F57AA|nr:hypothetical protein [Tissierella carlieri]MBU5314512.1 hypothetical protein [Tissierella carlieri]
MIWVGLEGVLLLLSFPTFRNKINKQSHEVWKRTIATNKSRVEVFLSKFKEIIICIVIGIFAYSFLNILSDAVIQALMQFWQVVFVVAFLPIIMTWIQDKNSKIKTKWHTLLLLIGLVVSIVSYFIDIESIEDIEHYKMCLAILLSVFFAVLVLSLFKVISNNQIKPLNRPFNSIRKDLFYRTTNLDIRNIDNIELSKMCEQYFDRYLGCYKKIIHIERIEYVSLLGRYRGLWYKRAEIIMKNVFVLSALILFIRLLIGFKITSIINVAVMLLFYVNVIILKNIDKEYLYKIGITYFYSKWGYCLYYQDDCKFVGDVQLIENSKYHKYVHSVLDIAALCRAAVYYDKYNKTEKIKTISRDFYELFDNYATDINSNWIKILPLWIISLFEFSTFGELSQDIIIKLGQCCKSKSERQAINMFLFSCWVDMTRQMPGEKVNNFISHFMNKIKFEIY